MDNVLNYFLFRIYLLTWNVVGRPPVEDLRVALGLTDPVDVSNLPDVYALGYVLFWYYI